MAEEGYKQALQAWARTKVSGRGTETLDVELDLDPGYACCGGSNPDCYCSYAESPSVQLVISAGSRELWSSSYFDLHTFLQELFAVA